MTKSGEIIKSCGCTTKHAESDLRLRLGWGTPIKKSKKPRDSVSRRYDMNIQIREITAEDRAQYDNPEILDGRKAVVFTDDKGNAGILYMPENEIEELGEEYIAANSKLEYSAFCETWFASVSRNAYENDLVRHPPIVIDVTFVERMMGEDTEIWKRIDGKGFLMRQRCREPFARWLTCFKVQGGWRDGNCIRANVTFRHGGQTETVTFDDWNGPAAYSNTFNPNFGDG